jgi:hypothetical protein
MTAKLRIRWQAVRSAACAVELFSWQETICLVIVSVMVADPGLQAQAPRSP